MKDVQKMENDMVSNLYFCNISFVVICLKMTVGFIQFRHLKEMTKQIVRKIFLLETNYSKCAMDLNFG